MYSDEDELSERYDYPVEYYHYPSLFPRVTSRFMTRRRYNPPVTRAEIRATLRAHSEERDVPRLTCYRSSSLPPLVDRCSTPTRDLTPFTRSKTHVYGTRSPDIDRTKIDSDIMYRPGPVAYTPRAIRFSDYETGPVPTSTSYRTPFYYRDFPNSFYDSRTMDRVRHLLEPRITSPISKSILPYTRYRSSAINYPATRYLSTPSRAYISYPLQYSYSPSRYYGFYEPNVRRSTHIENRYEDGYPTKFTTYKMVYPSIYSDHRRCLY